MIKESYDKEEFFRCPNCGHPYLIDKIGIEGFRCGCNEVLIYRDLLNKKKIHAEFDREDEEYE